MFYWGEQNQKLPIYTTMTNRSNLIHSWAASVATNIKDWVPAMDLIIGQLSWIRNSRQFGCVPQIISSRKKYTMITRLPHPRAKLKKNKKTKKALHWGKLRWIERASWLCLVITHNWKDAKRRWSLSLKSCIARMLWANTTSQKPMASMACRLRRNNSKRCLRSINAIWRFMRICWKRWKSDGNNWWGYSCWITIPFQR